MDFRGFLPEIRWQSRLSPVPLHFTVIGAAFEVCPSIVTLSG